MTSRNMRSVPRPPGGTPPEINLRGIAGIAALVVGGLVVLSSIFQVQPEEVGVVLTFGRYTRQVEPGLAFKLPTPIQTVIKVPVERQLKEEFGFRTQTAGIRSTFAPAEDEAQMLTGDLNVVVVEWTTQYRVNDPVQYLFRQRSLRETFRDANQAIMRAVVGDRSVTEVLTIGRQEIASEVEQRLQQLCDQYEMGIKIEQVVLQDVNPPDEVKPSFNEVNQAQQERERMINEARTAFNKVIPRAKGEALQAIQEAEGYATDRINRAKGEAARFNDLLAAYKRAPEVTRRRIYLETMRTVLPETGRRMLIDGNLKGVLPLLTLDGGDKK